MDLRRLWTPGRNHPRVPAKPPRPTARATRP